MYSILNGYSNNNYLASIINAAPPPLANLTKISDAESTSIVEILYFSGLTDESAKKKPVHTTTPTAWSHVSGSILFRSITAIPMKLTMNTRAKIMMTTIQTGLMITTTMRVITTISEINKIQQEYFTSILLDKVKTA